MKLPRRQSIVFEFIKAFETANGRRPSVVEISNGLDMPHGWTWKVVVALERKGLASRVQNQPRVTKKDVFKLHEQHPDWPASRLAASLKCTDQYVRNCRTIYGLPIPFERQMAQ